MSWWQCSNNNLASLPVLPAPPGSWRPPGQARRPTEPTLSTLSLSLSPSLYLSLLSALERRGPPSRNDTQLHSQRTGGTTGAAQEREARRGEEGGITGVSPPASLESGLNLAAAALGSSQPTAYSVPPNSTPPDDRSAPLPG